MSNKPWLLITGGAQRIGQYLNQRFAEDNYNIILHYHRSTTQATQLQAQLETLGNKVILWQADLSKPESINKALQELFTQVPSIDVLINNASIFESGNIKNTSLEQIQNNINIHLTSPWLLIQAMIKQAKNCQIINILDANLTHKYTSKSAYFIAKNALKTLTELAAIECAPDIRVNAIAPGFVLDAIDTADENKTSVKEMNLLQKKVPLADLYASIQFLLSNYSLTGQTINTDGGSHLQCPPYMLKT